MNTAVAVLLRKSIPMMKSALSRIPVDELSYMLPMMAGGTAGGVLGAQADDPKAAIAGAFGGAGAGLLARMKAQEIPGMLRSLRGGLSDFGHEVGAAYNRTPIDDNNIADFVRRVVPSMEKASADKKKKSHPQQRLLERTNLPKDTLTKLLKAIKRYPVAKLPQKFHIPLMQLGNVKASVVMEQFGGKLRAKTVLEPHMKPPGRRMFPFDATRGKLVTKLPMKYR